MTPNAQAVDSPRQKHARSVSALSQPGSTKNTVLNQVSNTERRITAAVAVPICTLLLIFVWAYWSTLANLISVWNNQPDYSHGFLVPLLSVFFVWNARERFPGIGRFAWAGLALVVLSLALRILAGRYQIAQIDAWSIPLWIAGVVWMFGGTACLLWSLPAILFLYFMVPLPYRMEGLLSQPLQSIATKLSAWMLQCLGQAAIVEGHTIHLGEHRLEVEQACSGLRMLVGIAALAVAYLICIRKSWWERALLLASVVPVALLANAIRITATGLVYQYVSSEAGKTFTHDFAGWAMILLAVGMFGFVLWYLGRLFPEQEVIEVGELLGSRFEPAPGPERGGSEAE